MHRSPIATQTYLLVDAVLTQGDAPPGFPPTWGTHAIDIGGYPANTPVQADYAMDPEVIASDSEPVADALRALPSLSLVMDIGDFETLYANPRERGPEWERPVSVEMIYPRMTRRASRTASSLTPGYAYRAEPVAGNSCPNIPFASSSSNATALPSCATICSPIRP